MKVKNKAIFASMILVVLGLLSITTGITMAFFNYTRTGGANTIQVGRIAFRSSQIKTINLTNVFPIDSDDVDNDENNVGIFELEIEGDTDYSNGIEYLVSSFNTTNNLMVPISFKMIVTNLGNENIDYFSARNNTNTSIYKKLSGDTFINNQPLLVGFIKQNENLGTASGINGKIVIKAYLDEDKIAVSDTYNGTESANMETTNAWVNGRTVLTTNEWNSLSQDGLSFQIRVEANEGIWVKETLYNIMQKSAVIDTQNNTAKYINNTTPGIDFSMSPSNKNGKGVYIRGGTENDAYPIMYYRGDVNNNNVLFANKCWKMVRTTDTGGVKLLYNGELAVNYPRTYFGIDDLVNLSNDATNPYSYNSTTKEFRSGIAPGFSSLTISFQFPSDGDYVLPGLMTFGMGAFAYIYVDDNLIWTIHSQSSNTSLYLGYQESLLDYDLGSLTTENVVKIIVYGHPGSPFAQNFRFMLAKEDRSSEPTYLCDNSATKTTLFEDGYSSFKFNNSANSLAYVGYMYGSTYSLNSLSATAGAYFGNGFTYANGVYTLTDTSTTLDENHHYTCNLTSSTGSCATIRYYYYVNGSNYYYINLTGGEGINDALKKVHVNTNDSNAKQKIDLWYENNLSSFANKLEDTIWCNNREVSDLGGFNPNGGLLNSTLQFATDIEERYYGEDSSQRVYPDLSCPNKNDAFTVNNGRGNKLLTYPVAMLTSQEATLAGLFENSYINGGTNYWLMTPSGVLRNSSQIKYYIAENGMISYQLSADILNGLRPVVSLKAGVQIEDNGADGTIEHPYKIVE